MTVLVAVRTGSGAVFAADSTLTTNAPAGKNPDGSVRWLLQTYENAEKLAKDRSGSAMAAFAGHGNIGEQPVSAYFSRLDLGLNTTAADQDVKVAMLASKMSEMRRQYWKSVPDDKTWPTTTLLLAGAPSDRAAPRVWRISLEGGESKTQEILQNPMTWLEGTYNQAFSLLYGYAPEQLPLLATKLAVSQDVLNEALLSAQDLRPINCINYQVMPMQDAVDFAVFMAGTQVQMERFLPGMPACGGPIDVMTLEMAPDPTIRFFPGKTLHHPHGTTDAA